MRIYWKERRARLVIEAESLNDLEMIFELCEGGFLPHATRVPRLCEPHEAQAGLRLDYAHEPLRIVGALEVVVAPGGRAPVFR